MVRTGTAGAAGPRGRVDVRRRAGRPVAPVPAPPRDGRRGGALGLPGGPVGAAAPHQYLPGRHHVRDELRRRGGGGPRTGGARAHPGADGRRHPVPGRRSGAADLGARRRGGLLPAGPPAVRQKPVGSRGLRRVPRRHGPRGPRAGRGPAAGEPARAGSADGAVPARPAADCGLPGHRAVPADRSPAAGGRPVAVRAADGGGRGPAAALGEGGRGRRGARGRPDAAPRRSRRRPGRDPRDPLGAAAGSPPPPPG